MTPSRSLSPRHNPVVTLPSPSELTFKPLRPEDIETVRPYLAAATSRTCDFTVGGLFMWARYFNYSYAVVDDTLFIKGVTEDDVTRPAFSLPLGQMDLADSIELLKGYCEANGSLPLTFSAVPASEAEAMRECGARIITPLDDWSDYLYEASALDSLSGKRLAKKRNHVNRFMADNPGYTFLPITPGNIGAVREFYDGLSLPLSKPALADIEREQVMEVLANPGLYGFEGAILATPAHGIVAFTMGEVIGDTLYTHIEKMNHEIAGAGETVNKLYAGMMLARHPGLRYINREEDTGDPGLRYAKESYHPVALLHKYNVTF